MDEVRVAPLVGAVACVVTVALITAPYLLVDQSTAVDTYYAAGVLTPWAVALLALVGVIVFAGGREERTDPPTAAGAGLALGGFAAAVAVAWASTVPASTAQQFGTASDTVATFLSWHRFLVAAAAVAIPASALWYARALRLV